MTSRLEPQAPAEGLPANNQVDAAQKTRPFQAIAEERANYLTHGAGAVSSLGGAALLLKFAAERSALTFVACSIYGLTLVLMFASSTVYHAVPASSERVKRALRTLDHSAIFLLIAGTYTALSLAVPQGIAAFSLLGGVWVLSALGIVMLARRTRGQSGPIAFYLALGALVALALPALSETLGSSGLWLLSAGGIVYVLGVPFYLARRLRYHHMIWHLFVLVASALHFLAVLRYVARG